MGRGGVARQPESCPDAYAISPSLGPPPPQFLSATSPTPSLLLSPPPQVKFIQRKHRYLLGRVESYRNQETGVVGGGSPTPEEKGMLGTTPRRPPGLRGEELDFNKRVTNLIIFPLSPWLAAGLSGFWPFPPQIHTI